MTRWFALAVIVGLAAGLPRASAMQRTTKPDASAGIAVLMRDDTRDTTTLRGTLRPMIRATTRGPSTTVPILTACLRRSYSAMDRSGELLL